MAELWKPRMLERLVESGWFPGRRIDLAAYRAHLEAAGFTVFPVVAGFLAEFGGLTIRYPYTDPAAPPGTVSATDRLMLDPILALQDFPDASITEYEQRVGMRLCPVGEAFWRYLVVLMANSGTVFVGTGNLLGLVGTSGDQAIEALCLQRRVEPVPAAPS